MKDNIEKKILIIDLTFVKQHKFINQKYIDLISEQYKVILLNDLNFYKKTNNNIEIKNVNFLHNFKNRLFSRISILINIKKSLKILKELEKNVDKVFVLTYDVITIYYLYYYIKKMKKELYLFEHQQLSEYDKPIKNFFTSKYKNNVKHIILEESFKDEFVKKNNIKKENIEICYHPLKEKKEKNKYQVLCISSSNDETNIKKLLEEIKERKEIRFSALIRSREISKEYHDKKIIFENRYYSDEEIENYYKNCEIVLILLNINEFKMRLSGHIFEALSFGKKVLLPKWSYSQELASKYPNTIYIIDEKKGIIDQIEKILSVKNEKSFQDEIRNIKIKYSDDNIKYQLRKAFK